MLTNDEREELWYAAKDDPRCPNEASSWIIYAGAIESAVLAKLREGGVELPEPQWGEHRYLGTAGKRDAYTEAQLLDYGDRREASGIEKGKALTLGELRAGGVELLKPHGYITAFSDIPAWEEKPVIDYGDRRVAAVVPDGLVADLSMMIRRLVLTVRRMAEDDSKDLNFANDCLVWIKHKGLAGTPLRDELPPVMMKVENVCTECSNSDSWGLPDKPVCKSCFVNSRWEPLNTSSVNPLPAAPKETTK